MDKKIIYSMWNAEIYRMNENSIRVSQVIIASFVIFTGVYLSRKISSVIKNRLLKIKNITESLVTTIQRTVSNTLIFITFLIALPIAGIPITAFTVLGGAAAIGIGFGMQNLFNNMISSIIILLERPVKVGDIIEITEQRGIIREIGTRRIKILRSDGIEVLIPNSYFLEQPLINWTLSDKNIRAEISVGVEYGSDINRVKTLLNNSVLINKKIIRPGEIKIMFDDFGDSALIFRVLFWTHINKPIELEEIKSDIRFEIYHNFSKENIVIAFPQLDLHLYNKNLLDKNREE